MPTHIGIGFSSANDPVEAFKEAAIEAKSRLNTVRTDLVIVFATEPFAHAQGIASLQRILQPKRLIGTVTPGILFGDRVETTGVGILAMISDELHFGAASLDQLNLIPLREAGYNFAQALLNDHQNPQRNACLFFYDGIRKNGTSFCAGLREALGNALPSIGGIGVNSSKLTQTRHFYQDRILSNAAIGLLIGGANSVSVATRHSWKPLGKPRIIDIAEENIIRTIDKQPARRIYENYFGTAEEGLTPEQFEAIRLLYPLGIGTPTPREYSIRIPIDIPEDGSILCQGEITTGSRVHLMITDKDACRQTMREAAMDIRSQLFGKQPKFVLVLESIMRRKILGRGTGQGLRAIQDVLGHTVPIFGMYTIGEAAPVKAASGSQLLNGSIVLLAIG